jgi:hypothetical protein
VEGRSNETEGWIGEFRVIVFLKKKLIFVLEEYQFNMRGYMVCGVNKYVYFWIYFSSKS